MPILGHETDLSPEDLLDHSHGAHDAQWFVAHTLPRREKDLMRRLAAAGVGFYGPTVARRFRSPNGRKRVSYVPLFAGYVFTKAVGEAQKLAIFDSNAVCKLLPVADTEQLLRDLRQVRQLVDTGAPLTPEARLEQGHRVRIRSGPMLGLEGTVVSRRGQDRLLVAVEFLDVGASVQLDDCELERLNP